MRITESNTLEMPRHDTQQQDGKSKNKGALHVNIEKHDSCLVVSREVAL